MCQGLCVGCGYIADDAKVREHCLGCPDYARLYREDPASLSGTVQDDYRKWVAAGRPAARAAAHAVSVAETDARRKGMAERFASRDILDDLFPGPRPMREPLSRRPGNKEKETLMPVSGSWDEYFATRKWRVANEVTGEARQGKAVISFNNGRFEIRGGYFTSPMSSARGAKGVLLQEVEPDYPADIAGSRIAVGVAVLRRAREAGSVSG